ncbi:type II toxin-antitoxin system RelB/DinJ family antitoxin [Lacticaseibacillus chiayiensis]|uniref:type II toxin-antitoxin system RelB/DinJ family antitoxin n=1 Tax=Lacticaseibacillus chiayiensis TaxID=2100821 RepID=UPI001304CCCD|nr:type II toxin-antitoxin system RelB/DinJ family antitoxin [Lacticaseibacillus chiayiensis]QVI34578.1 type II toxin-antitoxin system RelB/DinJ family antitoxin [Lacticaseibacillus chiayiensis]
MNFIAAEDQITTTIRLGTATKEAAEKVFKAMGMDLNAGINIFLKQVIRDQALPFTPTARDPLDQATENSLQDLKDGRFQDFENVESLFADLHDEINK